MALAASTSEGCLWASSAYDQQPMASSYQHGTILLRSKLFDALPFLHTIVLRRVHEQTTLATGSDRADCATRRRAWAGVGRIRAGSGSYCNCCYWRSYSA